MSFPIDNNYVAPGDVPEGMTAAGHLCLHRDAHKLKITNVAGDISYSPGLYWLASVTMPFIPWTHNPSVAAVGAAPGVAAVPAVHESYEGCLHYLFCLLGECFFIEVGDAHWEGIKLDRLKT